MLIFLQLFSHSDRPTYAVERVVGVHQEDAVVRQCSGVSLKCFALVFKKHDPTVRLRAAHRNAVVLTREQVRCSRASTDVSSTRRAQTAVHSLSSAQSKLDHRVIFSSHANPRGFRSDQALKI